MEDNAPLVYSPVKHRYRLAAKAIGSSRARVLDVGGYKSRAAHFAQYIADLEYVSINVGPAWYADEQSDVVYDGDKLPYADRSFPFVVSVDTLEHIRPYQRATTIREIVRVASCRAIIVVPISHGDTSDEERFVLYSQQFGIRAMPSLAEHVKFGLPNLAEIQQCLVGHSYEIAFASPRHLYWSFQLAMLLNQAALGNVAESFNRPLNAFMEDVLERSADAPLLFEDAYRIVVTVRRDSEDLKC